MCCRKRIFRIATITGLLVVMVAASAAAETFSIAPRAFGFYGGLNIHTGGDMQDIYGVAFRGGLALELNVSPSWFAELDAEYQNASHSPDQPSTQGISIHTISVLALLNRRMPVADALSISLGAGTGPSTRIVSFQRTYDDFSVPVLARVLLEGAVSPTAALTLDMRYTYHYLFTSDSESGDLGNTGGISFNAGIRWSL